MQQVYLDEQSHAAFLTGALVSAGVEATAPLEYEFTYTDVETFVALAGVIEGVGVSALVLLLSDGLYTFAEVV